MLSLKDGLLTMLPVILAIEAEMVSFINPKKRIWNELKSKEAEYEKATHIPESRT